MGWLGPERFDGTLGLAGDDYLQSMSISHESYMAQWYGVQFSDERVAALRFETALGRQVEFGTPVGP